MVIAIEKYLRNALFMVLLAMLAGIIQAWICTLN
jgi:hypothetical protein